MKNGTTMGEGSPMGKLHPRPCLISSRDRDGDEDGLKVRKGMESNHCLVTPCCHP